MKNTKTIKWLLIGLSVVVLFFLIVVLRDISIISSFDKKFKVVNELGEPIDVTVFARQTSPTTRELFFYFNKEIHDCKIVMIREHTKQIGKPACGYDDVIKAGNFLILTKDFCNEMHIYNELLDGRVTDYGFSEDTISFNTFDDFANYGKKVIIVKN